MESIDLRFKTSVAGIYPTRPGRTEVLDFQTGETYSIPRELAAKWISSGIAEPANSSRSAEVETATREPRTERAVRVAGRRHRR